MEGVSVSSYKGLKAYWKRKDYKRLDGSGTGRRRKAQIQLGTNKKTRFWKIKIKPRFRFFFRNLNTPKKFFVRLRDAYVNMMIGFGNSRVFVSGYGGGGNGTLGYGGFGKRPLKEYDEKMIIEIYKSLVLQKQL